MNRKTERPKPAARGWRWLRWLRTEALPLLAMLLLLTSARSSFANHYHVPSGSMEPALMPGDRVLVDMSAYGLRIPFTGIDVVARGEPKPGDVAVFDSPLDGTRLVKRVVAVGGQRIELRRGWLTVDGRALRARGDGPVERFPGKDVMLNLDAGGGPDIPPATVPEGYVLVLGDHRGNSLDGRFFGLVPEQALYGRAVAVYFRRGEGFVWRRL
ncbi:signal peptidase I [Vulcaniibacterium tengchongense]|uniref:Signal peptidase I n=1 Tax=Vulcaniibacterium tengchongense TaxID=1273429 RepID=A0A3N4VE62_9GAMM|nr:signal peptidase I [Vulcaniibacterium tengchongense]RPE75447.1 signal peptidase I [Vulcaniibacterium tengchongense]